MPASRPPGPRAPRDGHHRSGPRVRAAPPAAALGLFVAACLVAAGGVAAATVATGACAARSAPPSATLDAPLDPFSAARLFDRPDAPWSAGHRGIDLAAVQGQVVAAPGDGVVVFAAVVVDRGVVTVDHGGGLVSSLEPIVPNVAVGDRVRAGDPLGVVSGEPGHCAPRTCVHWGVRFEGEYVNPLDVLAGYGRIVLLP